MYNEIESLKQENERLSKECGEWHDKCIELESALEGAGFACAIFALITLFVSCYAVIISMNYFW